MNNGIKLENFVNNKYKDKVIELADEMSIHELYALVKKIRGER